MKLAIKLSAFWALSAVEWEHLAALHEHNRASLTHSHVAHENAEHEHLGEAHIHDRSHPSAS
jgi:hypothetical protein